MFSYYDPLTLTVRQGFYEEMPPEQRRHQAQVPRLHGSPSYSTNAQPYLPRQHFPFSRFPLYPSSPTSPFIEPPSLSAQPPAAAWQNHTHLTDPRNTFTPSAWSPSARSPCQTYSTWSTGLPMAHAPTTIGDMRPPAAYLGMAPPAYYQQASAADAATTITTTNRAAEAFYSELYREQEEIFKERATIRKEKVQLHQEFRKEKVQLHQEFKQLQRHRVLLASYKVRNCFHTPDPWSGSGDTAANMDSDTESDTVDEINIEVSSPSSSASVSAVSPPNLLDTNCPSGLEDPMTPSTVTSGGAQVQKVRQAKKANKCSVQRCGIAVRSVRNAKKAFQFSEIKPVRSRSVSQQSHHFFLLICRAGVSNTSPASTLMCITISQVNKAIAIPKPIATDKPPPNNGISNRPSVW